MAFDTSGTYSSHKNKMLKQRFDLLASILSSDETNTVFIRAVLTRWSWKIKNWFFVRLLSMVRTSGYRSILLLVLFVYWFQSPISLLLTRPQISKLLLILCKVSGNGVGWYILSKGICMFHYLRIHVCIFVYCNHISHNAKSVAFLLQNSFVSKTVNVSQNVKPLIQSS